MMRTPTQICVTTLTLFLQIVTGLCAEQINCPLNPAIEPDESITQECGQPPDRPDWKYQECINKVNSENIRIYERNNLMRTCKEADEKRLRDLSNRLEGPPKSKSSISERLSRARQNAEESKRSDENFFEQAYQQQHADIETHKATAAAQKEKDRKEAEMKRIAAPVSKRICYQSQAECFEHCHTDYYWARLPGSSCNSSCINGKACYDRP